MNIKLRYIGKTEGFSFDTRQWDVVSPKLPGYEHSAGFPSFGIEMIQELIKKGVQPWMKL